MPWNLRGNIKGATGSQGPPGGGGSLVSGRATGTNVGTTLTAIAGCSVALAPGTWFIEAEVYLTNSGTNPACTLTLVSSGGLVASSVSYDIVRQTASANSSENKTTFNSASGSLANGIFWKVVGRVVVTTGGTVSISMTRSGGTSSTAIPGSYLTASPST